MGNPNPFYRFKQGWNAGFYPDNQIVSDLLNEIYSAVTAAYPSWVTPGVTTISQLKTIVKNLVQPYNDYPYYGNFSVNVDLVDAFPLYNFTLTIRDNSLYAVDNTQEISISGTASNPGKVIATSALNAFVVGSYSGAFDATLVTEEEKAAEALNVVNLNGSAVFPITYSYNSTSGIATSGLSRAKNLQLFEGQINRLPADNLPKLNKRTFQLPQLTGDDSYIISIMERIIQASLIDSNFSTGIVPVYNSFQNNLPDGWASVYTQPPFTTYERVQFIFTNNTSRKFILVGRKDNTWLWQRFVTDDVINPTFDFLAVYTETTALPYEPNQAGRWLYNSNTYDYEFVEFTSGCYVSPEFYPMPAKPGDQWQFNVVDANLTGINEVSVGLFSESGDLVQKIGDAVIAPATMEISGFWWTPGQIVLPYANFWGVYDSGQFARPEIKFQLVNCDNELIGSAIGVIPAGALTTNNPALFINAFNAIVWDEIVLDASVAIVGSSTTFSFTLSSQVQCNCGIQVVMAEGDGDEFLFINPANLTTNYPLLTQHQASVTIPSKQGCYRMGMYKVPGETPPQANTCEVTYQKIFTSSATDDFLAAIFALATTNEPYVTFSLNGQSYTYNIPIVVDPYELGSLLVSWANSTIPGMVAVYDDNFVVIGFEWTIDIDCETEANFSVCSSYANGECISTEYPFFITESACCPCEPKCQATFQNDIAISGCSWVSDVLNYEGDYFGFFLTDSASFPYENKTCLYKISVADLLAGEGDDFCNFWANLTNWLGEIPEMSYTLTWPDDDECISAERCDYQFSFLFTPYIPCNTNYKFTWGVLDSSDNLLELQFNYDPVSCECPPPPPATGEQYELYSLSNIINIDKADCFSTILEFWADSNSIAQGMEYYNDWKQRVRIGLNGGGEKPVIEESLYRQSNGVHRRPQNKQDLSLDLHTDFFDLETQLAMTDATRHPYLIWEGKSIFVKGDIEVATTQDFTTQSSFETLSQMKFQALIQGFQPRNSSCLTC